MGRQERVDHRQRLGAERALEVAELDDVEDRALGPADGRGERRGLGLERDRGGEQRGQRRRADAEPSGDGS
jgi:hypothetical protein